MDYISGWPSRLLSFSQCSILRGEDTNQESPEGWGTFPSNVSTMGKPGDPNILKQKMNLMKEGKFSGSGQGGDREKAFTECSEGAKNLPFVISPD